MLHSFEHICKKAYKKDGKVVRVWLQKGPNMIFQSQHFSWKARFSTNIKQQVLFFFLINFNATLAHTYFLSLTCYTGGSSLKYQATTIASTDYPGLFWWRNFIDYVLNWGRYFDNEDGNVLLGQKLWGSGGW